MSEKQLSQNMSYEDKDDKYLKKYTKKKKKSKGDKRC